MIPSALSLRLQHLEENTAKVLQLLNEYEAELLDEDDPGKKSKYHRRVERLKKQKVGYEEEFVELRIQLTNHSPLQAQTISDHFQEINNKIELLLDNQVALSQALLSHFNPREKALLLPFTQQLDQSKLIEMQAFLEAVDTNQASEEEVQLMLTETRQMLRELEERNLVLQSGNEAVIEMINAPTIDAKHALKVSIPIIPFILAYEGELGLGTGIKLKEIWQHWKSKFYNK